MKRITLFLIILGLTSFTAAQSTMTRQQILSDIEKTLGLVPTFFKLVPERSLELEWELFKTLQLKDSPIPAKYRELIGVAISAVTKCRYCSFFHTEVAKLMGASDDEIEDAVHYAKSSAGWSTYINGLQLDYEQFRSEVLQSVEYLKNQTAKK